MTEQQQKEIIALAKKLDITNDNPEFTLIILARFYGLDDEQIIKILEDKEKGLMVKHLWLLAEIFEKDIKTADWKNEKLSDRDKLERLLYPKNEEVETSVEDVLQYVINSNLSAQQIREIRAALNKGIPPKEIMMLIKKNNAPDIIRAFVELYSENKLLDTMSKSESENKEETSGHDVQKKKNKKHFWTRCPKVKNKE